MHKNITKLIIAISIFITLVSCEKNHKYWEKEVKSVDDMFRIFDNEIKLNAEIYIDDSLLLLNPFTIKIINDYILIQDIGNPADGLMSVYDMTNKRFIGKMLNHGKGPNEFLGLRMNSYGGDTLLALNLYNKYANLYSINEIKTCNSIPDRLINFEFQNKGEIIDQCYLFDNKLICSGQFQKGRFHIYDTKGKFINAFDEYPKVNFGKIQIDNLQLGYIFGANVSFGKNSQMSKIACIGSSTLSIYDYCKDKDEFSKVFFIQWFFPKIGEATYKDGKPYVTRSAKDCMVGAGNLVANDKYLFFPFSTYSIADYFRNGIDDQYKFIFVTNWDGVPVAKIEIDKAIRFPLEIDKDGKYLYSIHTDLKTGFAQIIRYDISFLK